jgi:hypothetical protein
MIDKTQVDWESQFAIVYFREKAIPCVSCGKQPDHDYQPGARLIWCGGVGCSRSVTDSTLDRGFNDWNSMQNNLAISKRKR